VEKVLAIVFVLFFGVSALYAQPITTEERQFVIGLLDASAKSFAASIASVTTEQWLFKPGSESWSVAEIAEHITLSEDLLFSIAQKTLSNPADSQKAKALEARDQMILERIADRSSKSEAPEVIRPTGRFSTKKQVTDAFLAARANTIAYLQTTDDPLKNHVGFHPFVGEMTAYQWFVFIAGHTDRHVGQLLDVKSNPKFPKM
jgi:hypothetical protein